MLFGYFLKCLQLLGTGSILNQSNTLALQQNAPKLYSFIVCNQAYRHFYSTTCFHIQFLDAQTIAFFPAIPRSILVLREYDLLGHTLSRADPWSSWCME